MLHDTPAGDPRVALTSLDDLCAEGLVEACDEGRLLVFLCSGRRVDPAQSWQGACTVLQAAGRALPPDSQEPTWVEGQLPGPLARCFVVETVRTCQSDGNFMLDEPVQDPPCELSRVGCPPPPDADAVVFDVSVHDQTASRHEPCRPEAHPLTEEGTFHCFERHWWWVKRAAAPRTRLAVSWMVLPAFDGVLALVKPREVPAMTIEGTGARPVMRIGRTRAWLRAVDPR
jgi:hypothetical protein